ncbi:MAG TPA: phytoene desaturase [Gemmatimonadaceae bacterium]|nr:phytoene desaturase [Gemmatimonadaceae bacterium]
MRIVVIGAGFGGLAAAIRLRAQGHDVTLVERRDKPGGRAYVFEQDGFVFDAGPTIITAPWLIHELFELAGRRTDDYVSLVPLDPFYNVRFEDGSVFRYTGRRGDVVDEVGRFNPDDVPGYLRFARHADEIFRAGMALIDQPFTRLGDMARVVPDLVRLRADRSVAALVERHLRDERLRQVFSFHPLLVGGNPFRSTAIYALIHTLEQRWGVWFAIGGTGALVRALARLFEELGGTLLLDAGAEEIAVDPRTGLATGVRLAGGVWLPADAVVSNADVAYTYLKLVPPAARRRWTDRRVRRQRYSMSLFVLYFGTDRRYEDVAHHEILMGPRYRGLLDDIFTHKRLARDFSLYLHRPTATDPSLAPPGCDAWYVLSPVPHLGGGTDWATAAKPYRDAIVRYLEERYLPGLSRHIVTERAVDPRYFRDELNSHLGSAFSVEPILTQSAWFRPHNRSEDVPNLYFAGAGTHPGAGIPGVLSSGKIVAEMIGRAESEGEAAVRREVSLRP